MWPIRVFAVCILLLLWAFAPGAVCQLVNTGGGPGTIEPQVAALDFAELRMANEAKAKAQLEEKERQAKAALVDSGTVSVLDLSAPPKAAKEYNKGVALLRSQHPQEAIDHLQSAVTLYPKFVSAHNALGLAYSDGEEVGKAKSEFELAASLDPKFPRPLLNLGRIAIAENDYAAAQECFSKAAALRPKDIDVLTLLAYSQNGTQQYRDAIQTVELIHQLKHVGAGNAHYIAAAAALALNDPDAVERELNLFITEDATNPLAPVATKNLEQLARNRSAQLQSAAERSSQLAAIDSQKLANNERLKKELNALGSEGDAGCNGCELKAENNAAPALNGDPVTSDIPAEAVRTSQNSWTIRKVVDEVALFFAVSSHGHMVNDLEISDISIRDDGKPPEKVLQFAPQSKLPLRVGLLVDTSGSVQPRFGFEKYAASRFLDHLLTSASDLAFVMGFSTLATVVQDFTGSHAELEKGITGLKNGGGTSLFDAVSFACGKLAAYPESERVAKVLVILTDGEDNSSHTTLRRAISDAEASSVTIYAISTKDSGGAKTEADRILQELAERSGGEALFPQDNENLRHSFDKLRDIIRSRYLVAYKPAGFVPDGKYRPITVTATKNGSHLQVHARKGYHARLSPAVY